MNNFFFFLTFLSYRNQVPLWNHDSLRQCSNFIDLIGCIFAENRDPSLFSMVSWLIWNRPNNLRLGKHSCTLGQILQQAKERLLEYTSHHLAATPPSVRSVTSWCPPDTSWYKINFDGVLFE